MRLIEGVAGEWQQGVPERCNRFVVKAIGMHAIAERGSELRQFVGILLTHCLAQNIGLAEREVRHLLSGRHNLLLIDDETVGDVKDLRQWFFKRWVDRHILLKLVLALRVVCVRLNTHGTRSVKRDSSRDVIEAGRFHLPQQRTHRAAVQLEDPEGVARAQKLVSLLIGVEVELLENRSLDSVELDVR